MINLESESWTVRPNVNDEGKTRLVTCELVCRKADSDQQTQAGILPNQGGLRDECNTRVRGLESSDGSIQRCDIKSIHST